ncbi:MAG: MCP four helix bundle domain-containing protein [Bacteroidota bacterium]
MKIGLRLTVGFAAVMLGLLIIGFIGLRGLSSFDDEVDILALDRFPKTVWANRIIDGLNISTQVVRNLIILDDIEQKNKELARLTEAKKAIDAALDSLRRTVKSSKGINLLNEIDQARAEYLKVRSILLDSIRTGNKEAAIALLWGEFRNVQTNYFDATNSIINYQYSLVNQSAVQAEETYASSQTLVLVIGAVMLLLVFGESILITRSIVNPVNAVKQKMAQLESKCITNLGNGLISFIQGRSFGKIRKSYNSS